MPLLLILLLVAAALGLIGTGTVSGMTGASNTFTDLVNLARSAGFANVSAPIAAAIALAESGGDPTAYNKEAQDVPGRYNRTSADDGLGSYGLWQIYLAAHPEFQGMNLRDPQTNAAAAFSVYSNGGGFTAWATFNDLKYQKFLVGGFNA